MLDSRCFLRSEKRVRKRRQQNLELYELQEPIIEQYKEFLKENEITVAGIEFIRSADGTIYTYDINTNTNYNSGAE